ncbi:MAG TPA: hypothetical protein VG206_14425 [Terriglobia bacterium]|nr:hypothetical protein [Terriglobia bacterium]
MKKVFSLLFAAALCVSLAMPIFAQDSTTPSSDSSMQSAPKKEKKAKKAKKEKKAKSDTAAPASQ